MRATITAAPINTEERTVDLTLSITDDSNNLIMTDTFVAVSIDELTSQLVVDRITDRCKQIQVELSPLPLTQTQVNDMLVGIVVVVPD